MFKFRPLFFCMVFFGMIHTTAMADDGYTLPSSYYNSQGTNAPAKGKTQPTVKAKAQTKTKTSAPVKETTSSLPASQKPDQAPVGAPPADWEAEMIELQNQVDSLRKKVEEVNKTVAKKDTSKNVGYSGGFFIKDQDGKFKLVINAGMRLQYSFGISQAIEGQDQNNVHSFSLNGVYILFRGNAFTDKLSYSIYLAPAAPNSLGAATLTYSFNKHFNLTGGQTSLAFNTGLLGASSTTNQFITAPMAVRRFWTESVGLYLSGEIVENVNYGIAVMNGRSNGRDLNSNEELAYGAELSWEPTGSFGNIAGGDSSHSKKPLFRLETGGTFSHEETSLQERIIMTSAGAGIKFLGFNFYAQGFLRFVDPDDFTKQQIDASVYAQLGYYLIKDKLELGVRYSALFDDINDAQVNFAMNTGNLFSGAGDVDGDSNDEHQFSIGMAYNIIGVSLRAQAEYTYWYDGRLGQDQVNHLGQIRMHAKF